MLDLDPFDKPFAGVELFGMFPSPYSFLVSLPGSVLRRQNFRHDFYGLVCWAEDLTEVFVWWGTRMPDVFLSSMGLDCLANFSAILQNKIKHCEHQYSLTQKRETIETSWFMLPTCQTLNVPCFRAKNVIIWFKLSEIQRQWLKKSSDTNFNQHLKIFGDFYESEKREVKKYAPWSRPWGRWWEGVTLVEISQPRCETVQRRCYWTAGTRTSETVQKPVCIIADQPTV